MEQLVSEGLVRAIGLSNFNIRQIERILANCTVKPVMLQIESHPTFLNQELIDYAKANDILVTAYFSLGCPYMKL